MTDVPSGTVPCLRCGEPTDRQEAFLEAGGAVCPSCHHQEEASHSLLRGYKSVALGALGAALVSIFANPFFVVTLLAFSAVAYTFRYPKPLDEEDRRALKAVAWPRWVAVAAGIIAVGNLLVAVVLSAMGG